MTNISNISNISMNNIRIMKDIKTNVMDEYTIVLFLCFSAMLLIYMTRFIKPEPDEDEDRKNIKDIKDINPYVIFLSPLSPFLSPYNYDNYNNRKFVFDAHFKI